MTYTEMDWDAEEYVLGAMMLSQSAITAVLQVLEPDGHLKFDRRSHGVLYRAIRRLDIEGSPGDPVSVRAFLEAHGMLHEVNADGTDRLREIASLVPGASNAAHHAKIVRENWAKRKLSLALQVPDAPSAQERLALAEQAIMEARALIDGGTDKGYATAYELAMSLDQRIKDPPKIVGVPTPLSFLDHMEPGRVYVLAGYTGDGKTVMAAQFAKNAAKNGLRVGVFSIEMAKEQLFDRIVSSMGVPLRQVSGNRIASDRQIAYVNALKETATWQMEVHDSAAANASVFQRAQRLRHYDLLVIDHLHQITLGGKPDQHRISLEAEIQSIVTLARDEKVPILLVAQLSRSSSGRPWPIPNLTMLRDSGRIEQQAHMVCFVWRERDENDLALDQSWFIVGKNRSGKSGFRRELNFIGEEVRFVEVMT